MILSLGALSACGQQTIPNSSSQNTSNNTQNTSSVPGEQASSEGFLNAPVVAPPSYNDRPLQPGQSPQVQNLPNGLPALKPLKGVNVDTLFAENISSTDKRFDRLENAVTDMRREFEAVKPAIVRLVAVEEDIQNMVEQLEAMAAQEQARPAPIYQEQLSPGDLATPEAETAPAPQAEMEKPEPAKPMSITPPTNTNGATVKNLRTGLHSNKVRLVLDMSTKTPYNIDLDSSENILVIELPEAGWSGATTKTYGTKEPILASYSVESMNNNKGTRIIIPLKKSSSVLKSALLPPGVTPNYRMYVDLSL